MICLLCSLLSSEALSSFRTRLVQLGWRNHCPIPMGSWSVMTHIAGKSLPWKYLNLLWCIGSWKTQLKRYLHSITAGKLVVTSWLPNDSLTSGNITIWRVDLTKLLILVIIFSVLAILFCHSMGFDIGNTLLWHYTETFIDTSLSVIFQLLLGLRMSVIRHFTYLQYLIGTCQLFELKKKKNSSLLNNLSIELPLFAVLVQSISKSIGISIGDNFIPCIGIGIGNTLTNYG